MPVHNPSSSTDLKMQNRYLTQTKTHDTWANTDDTVSQQVRFWKEFNTF